MSEPSIDVVISAYNAASTLSATFASLSGQTDQDFSVIIYNDASTDGTGQVCERWQEALQLQVVEGDVQRGPGIGRNGAVSRSAADYVCFIDADDLVLPNHIAALRTEARKGQEIVSSRAYEWTPSLSSDPRRECLAPLPLRLPQASDQWPTILTENFMFGASLVSRQAFWSVGGFRGGLMEDWDLWIRLMRRGLRAVEPKDATYLYRVTPNSRGRSAQSFAIKMAVLDAAEAEMESDREWAYIQRGRRQLEALRDLDLAIELSNGGSVVRSRLMALRAWRAPSWRTRAAALRRAVLA